MHSYILNEDGTYTVGLWLATNDARGCAFEKLFDTHSVRAAHRAVNVLNGGEYQTIAIDKEY